MFAECTRRTSEGHAMLLAYLAIVATALAGLSGLGPWAIVAGAVALASISQSMFGDLYRRGREDGLMALVDMVILKSLSNAVLASAAAYGLGWGLRLM